MKDCDIIEKKYLGKTLGVCCMKDKQLVTLMFQSGAIKLRQKKRAQELQ